MIVKLHGNSGSGKTTIARMLMRMGTVTPLGNPKRPEAYRVDLALEKPLYVLGPYTNTCGGLDSVGTWRESADLLHKYAALGHVFYEGLLASTYYGSFGKETERYGHAHIFAFMDTPLEVCLERIRHRRIVAGNLKPLNEENTVNRQKPIQNVMKKCQALGRTVAIIKYDDHPLTQIMELYDSVPF